MYYSGITRMAYLNESYSVYFHCPYSSDWTLQSYKYVGSIYEPAEFWMFHEKVKNKIHMGIFFLMKTECFPSWDDESNRNGGVLCIKVLKSNLHEYWEKLAVAMLGETLLKDEYRADFDEVNGISLSPKRTFAICKIWLRSDKYNDAKYFNIPEGQYGEVLYKSNVENINISQK